jgi:hypothetical protein
MSGDGRIVYGGPVRVGRDRCGDLQRGDRGAGAAHQGATPAVLVMGSAKGSPPSGRETESSQSQSAAAWAALAGAMSSNTSKACSAAPG